MLRFITISIILANLSFTGGPLYAISSEIKLYNSILTSCKSINTIKTEKLSGQFFKRYPGSRYIPDIRLILAEIEKNPETAIRRYRAVSDKYRYFKKKDMALYRICEILSLQSRWNTLLKTAVEAENRFPRSPYVNEYRLFRTMAYINLNRYNEAENICARILKRSNRYRDLSRALIMLSYTNRKINGLSRRYIYNLREVLLGYRDSDPYPSAIYLTGKFYESKGNYNRAYSAYLDLKKRYPRSLESLYAQERLTRLAVHKPVKTKYLPDNSFINSTEQVDISPDFNINVRRTGENINKNGISFTVAIGPLTSLKLLKSITKELNNFGIFKTVKMRNGYTLFIGNYTDSESAVRSRIRLAEEYGINGRVIRMSGSGNKKYIYGE